MSSTPVTSSRINTPSNSIDASTDDSLAYPPMDNSVRQLYMISEELTKLRESLEQKLEEFRAQNRSMDLSISDSTFPRRGDGPTENEK